ncbi:HpcH/HpaI aldolase/citrate lyase family protein [Aureimonas phyllosphaerae]|uniref:Citrate lyase subunit beta/citryl-CoA lyase n=1 Tax=Aureimonas phyllosphaerae TaxID=1166078 RepID=A0A7W6BQC8_9HYPH|nr:CoA ester lyase [Aureimonas phyllosphaerae]MBB3936098.1 citrate lyase subunit beta/citryl-CoA lyase [Aureimonas phyllosphaerae]MBB3960177.1 citrate lyase subunit beta/citryl-CoA lyase [Aureimonas phyllosphaerae]SFF34037.1 citrate lyase subunit beta / citryl-CoA lyase [Aureimonas phyllosphaerae]
MTRAPAALLRSALFVPAANARALEKSASLAVDALIFDLEDSAAEGEKGAARERLRGHLATRGRQAADGPLRVVRINPLDTPAGTEDLLMACAVRADAILLPKVEGPEALEEADTALQHCDAPPALALWAMVETPMGVLRAGAIAGAALSRSLGALVVGPNDLALAAGLLVSPGRPELMPWIGPILVAGHAHGVPVLDGVFNDLADSEGFAAECAAGRRFGFCGKTLIHPSQIDPADAAFGPTPDEIARAEAIVAAFSNPAHRGRGVIRLGTRMVERLHLAEAEALLARAALIRNRKD